ncbi:DUF4352 domain-containing protein [Haloarcula salinisoli]|uniref:DUF4352 domain-containing protein n=1 Tax=Haloarcula salinisoli TaxID=2487746 RepID=A0A8J7YFX8_9EURY|nr:DUF4352 domain-containing protein [Halomicroarcula salinisoli]MBX0302643.1 DUF4352 domain-containing protein [Halomicroarcula salinisoli]
MDTPPSSTDDRSRRRYLSSLVGAVGALSLAGCAADDATDSDPPSTSASTPTGTPSAGSTDRPAVGDVVEGDRLAMVAYSVGRSADFETLEVLNGDGHVVVDVAVKNTHDSEYVGLSYHGGFTLRDGESREYGATVVGPTPRLHAGELAPGEVARGFVTFDRVPPDATGLTLEVTPTTEPSGAGTATITLESDGTGRTLTHDFAVPVHELGEPTEYEDTRFTATEVRTSTGSDTASPAPGNEFVFVDIIVENTGSDELFLNHVLQATLKDSEGRTYDFSPTAVRTIDNGAVSMTVAPGNRERAELGFEVEAGVEPLYLVMDLDDVWVGGRRFYQLR